MTAGRHARRMPRAPIIALSAVVVVGAVLLSLGLTVTRSNAAKPTVTISQATTGTSLTPTSLGLSFETTDLTVRAFTSGNLASYLTTLGRSVLRIGGNTVDQTFWTSTGATPPAWSIDTITPADLTRLAHLATVSGWQIILGVNLKHYSPAVAADEAKHARAALGRSLLAIEIGNEPDRYPQYRSDTAAYLRDFQAYAAAIGVAAPGVAIDGTDAAFPARTLQQTFITDQMSAPAPQIAELTSHNYPLISTTCRGNPTIEDMLGVTVHHQETVAADLVAAGGAKLGVPAVIDEGNNILCEGQAGVSDVFAAALWELDEQLDTALEGVAGDYKHGTILQCDSAKPLFMYYTPLCANTVAAAAAGLLIAQPEYYGLAAVHAVGTGTFLKMTNPMMNSVRAYAIRHPDGSMTVVLDDVQDPATNGATPLRLSLGASFDSAAQVSLVAAGLRSTAGISLGGQSVAPDGTLAALHYRRTAVEGDTMDVTVPAGSAMIITFSRNNSIHREP